MFSQAASGAKRARTSGFSGLFARDVRTRMARIVAVAPVGDTFTNLHFGANILATVDQLGADGTYDDVIQELGVTHIRYPGGSLTERLFDLSNPTNPNPVSLATGEPEEFLPYDEFMAWAEDNNISVTVVLPTLRQMTEETDANGDRYPDFDEEVLRTFIRDTLDGKYGAPEIKAFEIGNEYWGSGEMTSVEYGRLASEMAAVIDNEISLHPNAALYQDTDILVQMGYNYDHADLSGVYADLESTEAILAALEEDYGMEFPADLFTFNSGGVSWGRVANGLLVREFDNPEEIQAVDGVVAHVYGRGFDAQNSWYYDYAVADDTFVDHFDDITKYVTEWNSKSRPYTGDEDERFGLLNAHEMLNLSEAMTSANVEAANVWAVQQNTATDLSGRDGIIDLTPAGEMFRMMSESLPGLRKIDLEGSTRRETELVEEDHTVHLFAGEDRAVFFIAANGEDGATVDLDASAIFGDAGDITVSQLGVVEGDNPLSRFSEADITDLSEDTDFFDGRIQADLDSYEIMRVEVFNPVYTDEMSALLSGQPVDIVEEELEELAAVEPSPEPEPEFSLPFVPVEEPIVYEDDVAQFAAEGKDDEDGFDFGGLAGILLFPLMLLGG